MDCRGNAWDEHFVPLYFIMFVIVVIIDCGVSKRIVMNECTSYVIKTAFIRLVTTNNRKDIHNSVIEALYGIRKPNLYVIRVV